MFLICCAYPQILTNIVHTLARAQNSPPPKLNSCEFNFGFLLYKISTSNFTFPVPSSALILSFIWVLLEAAATGPLRLTFYFLGQLQKKFEEKIHFFLFPSAQEKKSDLALNVTLNGSSLTNTHKESFHLLLELTFGIFFFFFLISQIIKSYLKLYL